ncbi:hypothetical protein LINPERHAP2_LOCUS5660 [Linum perenne]
MDSRAAISILTSSDASAHQYTMEKMEFRDLARRDWSLKVEHTFREGNRSADFLASLGYGYPFGSHSVLISDCRLGYFLQADGFKGGVWIIWDPKVVHLDILDFGDQFIHARGRVADGSSYFLIAVYASPRGTRRVLLWDALKDFAASMSAPWAVVGDFNSILSAEDKRGGVPFSRARNKSFIDTVELCGMELPPALERLTTALKHWNKKFFGNIFKRKQRLVEKLKLAEDLVSSRPSEVNIAEEARVRANLELVLWQEEAIWVQKSRSKWIVEGDLNTHFFHLSALKIRAANRVKRLKSREGVWIDDQEVLSSMAFDHFRDFYSEEAAFVGKIVGFSGAFWSVRNGETMRFWTDIWLDSGTQLLRHALDPQGVNRSESSDSKAAVSILSNVDNLDHRHASLVEQFQALKNQDWEVSIHHIFREANNAADYLAKLGHDLALGTHVFLYPDSNILYWLSFDLVGSCLPRIINNIA